MKRPTLISLSLLTAVSFSAALVSTTMSTNFIFSKADEKTTTITLNSENAPQITDGSGSLVLNEYASFAYTNASEYEGGHVSLGTGGTIIKNQASNELVSFRVVFSNGDLTLNTGYSDSDDVCYVYELTSNSSQQVHGNYFKLMTNSGVNISEIEITFGCEIEETEGDHNFSSDWTTDETHHWHVSGEANCVRTDSYAEHTEADIDVVAPTKETAGSYNGKKCSVCDRVLVEPTVLPILSATDYNISYRTAMFDGEVRDSETYTLKTDTSISFEVPGDTVYTEYIHAGTSYYSLNRWNELFPDAIATYDNEVLTITLSGDTTVTAESGGDLDGMLDLTLYPSVIITGTGILNIKYKEVIDGINCYNLTIENGATVNLTGYSTTQKTAIKAYGALQIDGILNIDHYCYAFALTDEKNVDLAINVGASGHLTVTDCTWGVYGWNKPANNSASINLAGDTNISTSKCPFMIIKEGIDINVTGAANVSLTSSAAVGIYSYGSIYVRDNATLNINSKGGGIYGTKTIMVANGSADDPIQNNASLNVVSGGAKSSTGKDSTSQGLSKDGNMIQSGGTGTINMIFVTLGKVLVKCNVTGKTGIQFTSSTAGKQHKLIIKCADMTIENANNAIGCWVSSANITSTYDYNEPYAKLKLVSCTSICNSGTGTGYNVSKFAPFLESGAVERL